MRNTETEAVPTAEDDGAITVKKEQVFWGFEMMQNVLWTIRPFRDSDIEQIIEIETKAFPKSAYSKEILLNCARRLPETFLVLETAGGIEGYILYDLDGHIYSMAVEPSHRRRGYGRALFEQALDYMNDVLWLEVRSKNLGAIEFYRKMGMRVIGRVTGYYEADDALIMVADPKDPRQTS
jgi:ribosomal-protein-alanine N-acetyltransferase